MFTLYRFCNLTNHSTKNNLQTKLIMKQLRVVVCIRDYGLAYRPPAPSRILGEKKSVCRELPEILSRVYSVYVRNTSKYACGEQPACTSMSLYVSGVWREYTMYWWKIRWIGHELTCLQIVSRKFFTTYRPLENVTYSSLMYTWLIRMQWKQDDSENLKA